LERPETEKKTTNVRMARFLGATRQPYQGPKERGTIFDGKRKKGKKLTVLSSQKTRRQNREVTEGDPRGGRRKKDFDTCLVFKNPKRPGRKIEFI